MAMARRSYHHRGRSPKARDQWRSRAKFAAVLNIRWQGLESRRRFTVLGTPTIAACWLAGHVVSMYLWRVASSALKQGRDHGDGICQSAKNTGHQGEQRHRRRDDSEHLQD